jgi:hypothetical protein
MPPLLRDPGALPTDHPMTSHRIVHCIASSSLTPLLLSPRRSDSLAVRSQDEAPCMHAWRAEMADASCTGPPLAGGSMYIHQGVGVVRAWGREGGR